MIKEINVKDQLKIRQTKPETDTNISNISTIFSHLLSVTFFHRATYNALEATSIKIDIDLNDKNQSLETDTCALEMRAALEPKKAEGTDKNLILANITNEVPKPA